VRLCESGYFDKRGVGLTSIEIFHKTAVVDAGSLLGLAYVNPLKSEFRKALTRPACHALGIYPSKVTSLTNLGQPAPNYDGCF
jgi:hypothetical protein